jgi:hypothetical protein
VFRLSWFRRRAIFEFRGIEIVSDFGFRVSDFASPFIATLISHNLVYAPPNPPLHQTPLPLVPQGHGLA